jgi:hypothetical protein
VSRLSRESWLAIGLFVILVGTTVVAAASQAQQARRMPPLASYSSAPDGARALWLWLQALGYQVSDEVGDRFAVPGEAGIAFLLEPTAEITNRERQSLDHWVQDGGTLVVVGERLWAVLTARHYGFDYYRAQRADSLVPQTPLMVWPPLLDPAHTRSQVSIVAERDQEDGYVVHLADGDKPVMVSLERGAGRVILSTAPFVFSNAGLKEKGNPELVLNVVAAAKRRGVIWFDEWHHGQRAERTEVIGPWSWLRRTSAGRSLLYAAAVVFVALLLGGRRFGRPVPLPRTIARRAPLEYITAIANLSLRAGHRTAVLRHYYQQMKRSLGKRYRLDPTLHDGEYVARLQALNPNLDGEALYRLLARLSARKVSEGEAIQLAAEVALWLKES